MKFPGYAVDDVEEAEADHRAARSASEDIAIVISLLALD
jgi:hypothetical protein